MGFSTDLSPLLRPVGVREWCEGGFLHSHMRDEQSQVAGIWVWRGVLVSAEVRCTPGTDEGDLRSNLWTKESQGSCWREVVAAQLSRGSWLWQSDCPRGLYQSFPLDSPLVGKHASLSSFLGICSTFSRANFFHFTLLPPAPSSRILLSLLFL